MERDQIIFSIFLYILLDWLKGILNPRAFNTFMTGLRAYLANSITVINTVLNDGASRVH